MVTRRFYPVVSAILALFAVGVLSLITLSTPAQVCTYGTGGGSGSGGSGATLMTITVDGSGSDWGPVLANANQVTFDGEWVNCASSTDKDYVINPVGPSCASRSVSGRDLAVFAWTYDSTNVYLYVKRFGSANNTQTFYFYMDTNGSQRMNTGEKVYQVQLSGSNRRTDGTLYNYAAVDATNGDPLAAPAGSTYPGYADGYTVVGSIASPLIIYSNVTGGFTDGTGFEARIPWTNIGVSAGTPIYFHVSSTNSSNPGQVPASIDDNLGGVNGQVGAFAFRSLSVTPDRTSAATPASPTVAWYDQTVTNTGTLSDRYDLTTFSSLGLRVDLYLSDGITLLATDSNGDGDFTDGGDYVNPAYDSDADTRPNTPVLAASGTFAVKVKITAPAGVENVQDVTTLSAFSQADTNLCGSARDTTAIGALALTPTPQAKSVVAGQTVDYGLTLGNHDLSDTFDLRIQSSLGWKVEIYTDPNGDGNPSDGVLVATDVNGNGTYTDPGDSIAGGYDTDANNRPDFGTIANGGTVHFVVRLIASSGATVGTVDTCNALVQGATYGASATAVLTSTVRTRLTFTPNYTVAANTSKYSGQGQSVFYAHTLINGWPSSDTVTLSSTSNPTGWTIRYWTDPNGDGNPGDGTQITGSFSLAANGGTQKIVVEVVIPTGLTLPLTHTATVTATGSASSASVTDEVRVSYIAIYADPNRTLSQRVFALCQTIYAKGSSLVASSTYTFRYINPSSTVIRTQTVQSDGNGEALDQYTLTPGDTRGNWTLELRNASNALVDSVLVYVDPPVGNPSSVNPLTAGQASYALTGDNLSLSATFNNTSVGADYTGTTFRYLVQSPDLSQYLRNDGVFVSYSGSELTRSTSPHTVYASSSASETVTVNGVQFPTAGVYRIDATWIGTCSNSIAEATLFLPVGTTLASYGDSAHILPRDDFGTGATVYVAGTTYLPSTTYTVAYYRPDGTLALSHSATSTAGGALSDSATVASLVTNGTWHAVVYPSSLAVPPIYNASDTAATGRDSFSVDTVPPATTVGTVTTTNTSPALSGSVNDPNASVQVLVNGQTYAATNNGDGTWTLPGGTLAPALAAGVYDVVVLATDAAGNTGSDSTTDELTIQFPAPTLTGPVQVGASSLSGTSTAPVGTTITVYSNGVAIGTTTVQSGGTWTLSGVTGLQGGNVLTATAGTGAPMSAASNSVTVVYTAPVVNGPLVAGGTSVTGTSSAPNGTTVTVTVGGIEYTTTVIDGAWSVTVPPLAGGTTVSATTGTGAAQSAVSNTVTVVYAAPVVNGPLVAGGTSVTGTSSAPDGTTLTVTVGGVEYTTTVSGGTWSVTVPPLTAGAQVSATTGTGAAQSAISNTVTVIHAAPAVSGPVTPMTDTLTGTSSAPNGTVITVYQNGVPIGTTTVTDGAWSLTGFPALSDGATITATAGTGSTTSAVSAGVVVSVALLRFGGVTQTNPQTPANSAIFVTPAQGASLSLSRDLEKAVFPSGDAFAHEVSDLDAEASPLVFYQVAGEDSDTLRVTLSAGKIVITH